jgi:hypothetical protein
MRKDLLLLFQDNISKYEAVHGKIKEAKGLRPALPLTFGGPTAQA